MLARCAAASAASHRQTPKKNCRGFSKNSSFVTIQRIGTATDLVLIKLPHQAVEIIATYLIDPGL